MLRDKVSGSWGAEEGSPPLSATRACSDVGFSKQRAPRALLIDSSKLI